MFKKKRYIALAIVAVAALVLLNLPANTSARLRLAVSSQFLPLFGLAGVTQDAAGSTAELVLSKRELIRQNNQLRAEIQQLKLQGIQFADIDRENKRLAQLLGWKPKQQWPMKAARVVLRDPANWWSTVQIDLGSQHGIKTNMPVVAPDGTLVGRVSAVGMFRSQVVLVGDANCRVAVTVEEAKDSGVLGNASPLDREMVELNYLPRITNIKPGQKVITSNLGGTFPAGIFVGNIVDTQQVDYGLTTKARVKLGNPLGSLSEVWVLLL